MTSQKLVNIGADIDTKPLPELVLAYRQRNSEKHNLIKIRDANVRGIYNENALENYDSNLSVDKTYRYQYLLITLVLKIYFLSGLW